MYVDEVKDRVGALSGIFALITLASGRDSNRRIGQGEGSTTPLAMVAANCMAAVYRRGP